MSEPHPVGGPPGPDRPEGPDPDGAGGDRATYAAAGVDIDAADRAVERIKEVVRTTFGPEVLGGIGGFGGMFRLDLARWRDPVLVASTDGVGTKAMVAAATRRYATVGIDLVAMCVDDLVCQGAEPQFLLDYISLGRLDPDMTTALVEGVAEGCRRAGCALLGGEMAEHPGAMAPGEFDLAGFAVGLVERDAVLGPDRVAPGDVLVGLASPGLRSNGYSLARRVLLEVAGRSLDDPAWPGAARTVADELLEPSVIYAPAVVELCRALDVHAAAHVTGGGIPGNVVRMLPGSCDAVIHPGSWDEPPIFGEIRLLGGVAEAEMSRVFNLGLGMVVAVGPAAADDAVNLLIDRGHAASVVGEVVDGTGRVRMGRP